MMDDKVFATAMFTDNVRSGSYVRERGLQWRESIQARTTKVARERLWSTPACRCYYSERSVRNLSRLFICGPFLSARHPFDSRHVLG